MSTKHTPGKWHVRAPDEIAVHDEDGGRVAILTNLRGALGMSGRRDPDEVIANARLIAAAPEMLSLLRRFARFSEQTGFVYPLGSLEMQKIIAKATEPDAMSSNEERVMRTVAEQLGIPLHEVNATSTKASLGMDSLDDIEMVMAIEDEFRMEVPDEVTEMWVNVAAIVAYINARFPEA